MESLDPDTSNQIIHTGYMNGC